MHEGSVPRALVVDDDPAWQQIVSEILRDGGLIVDLASSPEEAERLLRERPHRVAVVDLALGTGGAANQDGLEVLKAVQHQDPGCAAILLTGYATVSLAVDALTSYGALSCLTKANFDRGEFQQLVARALSAAPGHARTLDAASASVAGSGVASAAGQIQHAILVVDDDAGWRDILVELLTDVGYRVRPCNSYGEALGCLRRERYAVAVVDLTLKGEGDSRAPGQLPAGYRLLEAAQADGIPAVVVSGMAHPEEIDQIYARYDLFAYLAKHSFDRRAFLQTMSEACASSELPPTLATLTTRELEVLEMLVQGLTNKELAEALFISPNTVKRHLKAIYVKLDVHTRAAAVAKAVASGLTAADAPSE